MPMNRSNSVIEDGVGKSAIGLTFVGRGRMPLLSTPWLRKLISETPKRQFSFFTTRPCRCQTIEQNSKVFFVFCGRLTGKSRRSVCFGQVPSILVEVDSTKKAITNKEVLIFYNKSLEIRL